jgi:aspartate 1-decarboxylase
MLWFDHAIWFILNNLERFFDSTYPILATKYGTFIMWLNGAAKLAVCHQITFLAFCRMMEDATVEYSTTPDIRLLAKYYKAPSARQVERFIKPAQQVTQVEPQRSRQWRWIHTRIATCQI